MGVLAAVRRLRPLAVLGLALYAFVFAASPALHHDLACHLKTPTHCDGCTASPVASRAEASAIAGLPGLTQAGTVETLREAAPRTVVPVAQSGRAPPTLL